MRKKLINHCSQVDPSYYCADECRVLGLCTGALPAAAVSCSRTTLELIPLAVHAVVAAFRTGLLVADVAQRIEPSIASKQENQAWSIIVPGLGSVEAVTTFCEQTVRSHYMSQYCSSLADAMDIPENSID